MRRRGEHGVLAAALSGALLLALLLPTGTSACGPFFPYAVFVNELHPDIPFGPYAAGNLGVLQPAYARSYLAVAYRSLSGTAFNAEEQKELLRLWDERLFWACYRERKGGWVQQWIDLRATVKAAGEAPGSIEVFKDESFSSYLNCTEGAFQNAVETLKARIAKYGASSPQVADWCVQQDAVFANCSGDLTLPAPPPAGASPEQRADRAYQMAAAQFYAGKFDEAARGFSEIAKDPSSPWRTLAPYLTVRCLIRRASVGEFDDPAKRRATLSKAKTALNVILADQALQPVHPPSRRLLNSVNRNLYPAERLTELERALMVPGSQATLYQDLWDYTALLDLWESTPPEGSPAAAAEGTSQTTPRVRWVLGDMSDWITTFQNRSPEAARHAVERWKQTKSAPWLAAAISRADKGTPELPDLLKAAAQVPASSPAYATASFHRARLLLLTGKTQEAGQLLNDLLGAKAQGLPRSTVNLLTTLRQPLDGNLEAFLADAARLPAAVCSGEGYGDIPEDYNCGEGTQRSEFAGLSYFDVDGQAVVNFALPLETLAAVAKKPSFPKELRTAVASCAFVRALLLERPDVAAEMAPLVAEFLPGTAPFIKTYGETAGSEDKSFYATYMLLKLPGLEPYVRAGLTRGTAPEELDSFRDNWWCPAAPVAQVSDGSSKPAFQMPEAGQPPFASAEMKKKSAEEAAAIKALGSGTVALCNRALDWAQKRPDDPLVPEALHNAVVATKLGACKDEETTALSKQVFNVLHKKYPKSEWTKQTPYYY